MVVLLLHGGEDGSSTHRVPAGWPPVLRMTGFLPWLRRRPGRPAVLQLRNSVKGWNGGGPPVDDARWALAEIGRRLPGVPVVLVGHSMGGRVGVRVLDDPAVVGLVGLAPWLTHEQLLPDLTGRRLLLVHGTRDRTIPIGDTRDWAARAEHRYPGRVGFVEVPGSGHAMLRRGVRWGRLARRGVEQIVESAGVDKFVEDDSEQVSGRPRTPRWSVRRPAPRAAGRRPAR